MGLTTQARDWKCATAAQIGGAAQVGGGVYWILFQSAEAHAREMFMFIGGGLGLGGSVGGANVTPDSLTAITCDQAFSVADLNMSPGRLTLAGAALAVGYAVVYISAFNLSGSLFTSQYVGGFGAGVGVSAQTLVGYWRSMTLGARDAEEAARGYMYRYKGR